MRRFKSLLLASVTFATIGAAPMPATAFTTPSVLPPRTCALTPIIVWAFPFPYYSYVLVCRS